MKQCTIIFPVSRAMEFAKWFAEQAIVTNLSFAKEGEGLFASQEVVAIIAFPDDKAALVEAKFQQFIKTKI